VLACDRCRHAQPDPASPEAARRTFEAALTEELNELTDELREARTLERNLAAAMRLLDDNPELNGTIGEAGPEFYRRLQAELGVNQ
jgi:hypothetical protein